MLTVDKTLLLFLAFSAAIYFAGSELIFSAHTAEHAGDYLHFINKGTVGCPNVSEEKETGCLV